MPNLRKLGICSACGQEKTIEAKDLCGPCYRKARKKEDPTYKQKDRHNMGTCIRCERNITICAKGMCGRCYTADRIATDPEYAAQRKAKQDAWNAKNRDRKNATQRKWLEKNKDRITTPRRPTQKTDVEFIPDAFCSVCDRSLNRADYGVDCDGLQAHGVCILVKGDRSGWKKPPYHTVV